jgi:hypothetical protein
VSIVPIIVIALLIAGVLAFVFRPLFEGKNGGTGRLATEGSAPAALTADELAARRDAIYASLKDAEFDRETGKLSGEDYQMVRARYMSEAAQILRQLDRVTPEAEAALDAEIERAVAGLRSNGRQLSAPDTYSPDLVQQVEAEIAALVKHSAAPAKSALACPDCGQPYQRGDTFCAACGAALTDTCPQCGAPHRPDDMFCTRCGASLAQSSEE